MHREELLRLLDGNRVVKVSASSYFAGGVETEEQYRFLARLGCHLGQGFGFARPQVPDRFADCVQAPPPWTLSKLALGRKWFASRWGRDA